MKPNTFPVFRFVKNSPSAVHEFFRVASKTIAMPGRVDIKSFVLVQCHLNGAPTGGLEVPIFGFHTERRRDMENYLRAHETMQVEAEVLL